MAEKRKLLMEMEKCFKKIDEGIEIFDEMMEDVLQMDKNLVNNNNNNNENQREKMQDDLKREIKKLQRLREQDKSKVNAYRRLIEQRMEKFKDTQIRKIQDEIDRTESKIEAFVGKADGVKRGKKDDLKKADRGKISQLKKHLQRVIFHVTNLEVCMRLVINDKLESADVLEKLKEPLDMYVEALEPENEYDLATLESMEPDDVYAELNLGDYIALLNAAPVVEETPRPSPPPPPPKQPVEEAPPKPAKTKWVSSFAASTAAASTPSALPPPSISQPAPPIVVGVRGPSYAAVAAASGVASTAATSPSSLPPPQSTSTQVAQVSLSNLERPPSAALSIAASLDQVFPEFPPLQSEKNEEEVEELEEHVEDIEDAKEMESLPDFVSKEDEEESEEPVVLERPQPIVLELPPVLERQTFASTATQTGFEATSPDPRRSPPPSLPEVDVRKPTDEMLTYLRLVNAAGTQFGFPANLFTFRAPFQVQTRDRSAQTCAQLETPETAQYPRELKPIYDTVEYYKMLDPETLFFIFYYLPDTRNQLLAARALKSKCWRFHSLMHSWFMRLERPVEFHDDYERGTFVMFCYDEWEVHKVENFTFEYRYLEDVV
ncbi:Not1 domain, CCR4-Not complex component [Aphelenchoides fujianensis]|nr:Not1 domain, CCR4-Not complex component [Aphelenchoides fujianensis]